MKQFELFITKTIGVVKEMMLAWTFQFFLISFLIDFIHEVHSDEYIMTDLQFTKNRNNSIMWVTNDLKDERAW